MKIKILMSSIVLMGFSHTVQAALCESPNAIKQVIQKVTKNNNNEFVECKVLPHQPQFSIIAVAAGQFDEDKGYGEYTLSIIKADSQTGTIKIVYLDPKKIISDAVTFSGIGLDTARYQLNTTTRAVGVRLRYTGASRVNPYAPEYLSLYDIERKKKVLADLRVSLDQGEWDGMCNGNWHTESSVLQMLKSNTQGYADIKVTTKILDKETTDVLGECNDANPRHHQVDVVLKFDGKQYHIPKQYR